MDQKVIDNFNSQKVCESGKILLKYINIFFEIFSITYLIAI